jgi:predicted PurR-regulated permease PerM
MPARRSFPCRRVAITLGEMLAGTRMLVPRRHEPLVSRLARQIDDVLGAFIRGQLIVMLALGLIYSIGLWAIGLDLAIIIGLTAGLLSIVPYLGTFVGVAAALIAAIFQFQDIPHLLLVAAVFVIGQMLEGMVLTPKLVGDRIGLHPVAVIFAVLAGGQLAGFLGILLALPVAAALNVLVRYLHEQYRNSDFYEQEPAGAPKPATPPQDLV